MWLVQRWQSACGIIVGADTRFYNMPEAWGAREGPLALAAPGLVLKR